jgi:hypothetical protein
MVGIGLENELGAYHGRRVVVIVKPSFKKFGVLKAESANFITLLYGTGQEQMINKAELVKVELDSRSGP